MSWENNKTRHNGAFFYIKSHFEQLEQKLTNGGVRMSNQKN